MWKNKENFQLDPKGYPIAVAGVPPDYFSSTGQRWGNPIYDWERMKEEGYNLWIQRLQYSSNIYDLVRIDHFRAFDTYWKIPASCKTAIEGAWIEGPSYDFFDCLLKASPDMQIIVEDLGDLREEVYSLRDHYGFKGMKILQFSFDPNETNNRFPDRKNMVLYTGTHDNLPIQGWLDLQTADTKATIAERAENKGDCMGRSGLGNGRIGQCKHCRYCDCAGSGYSGAGCESENQYSGHHGKSKLGMEDGGFFCFL